MVRVALLVLGVSMAGAAVAGPQPPDSVDSVAAAASAAFESNDWVTAEPLFEKITRARPEDFRSWYRLGVCHQRTGRHQAALDAFQIALAKGSPASIVQYHVAGVYASLGNSEQAIQRLIDAIEQGYAQPEQMLSDPDLSPIRSDVRFPPLVEHARHNQSPCDYSPDSRQFDFWVGDWTVVTTQDGAPAGISHIERVIGNCVIWENWTSLGTPGYSGKSYNVYNADLKRWEQFWVDSLGGMIHFYGGVRDGVMHLYTDETPQPSGTRTKRHMQFFNLGLDRVRQFSQQSTDAGVTWTVEYDLTYVRKK
jgi:tetratricopeptide (TPR) repeat protein